MLGYRQEGLSGSSAGISPKIMRDPGDPQRIMVGSRDHLFDLDQVPHRGIKQ
jgi:hypothetical protein